jgi:light-harvesting protein B-800-850 alpha chain
MNNAKMWLVVKPTVGVPLFLSAVAIGSFAVHVAVLSNTTWVGNFLQGKPIGTAALKLPDVDGAKALVRFDGNSQEGTVILPDGRSGKVIFSDPAKTAMVTAQ